MEHLSVQAVTDFVRGVSGMEISRDIKTHLSSGCSKCQTAQVMWSRVQKLATEESAYAPPENLVHLVKVRFNYQLPQKAQKWTLANLVFDSFSQPLQAGARSGALNVWQVIFEAEGLTVDLRFGRRAQSKLVQVVGQVLDKQEVGALQSNASIELATEQNHVIAIAPVSALGEFQLEFEAKDHLSLMVKTAGHNYVKIPLALPKC
jgi:hypothetical protein